MTLFAIYQLSLELPAFPCTNTRLFYVLIKSWKNLELLKKGYMFMVNKVETTLKGAISHSLPNPTSQGSGLEFMAGLGSERKTNANISKAAEPSLGCQQFRSFWVVLTLSPEMRTCQTAVSSNLNAALLLPSPTPRVLRAHSSARPGAWLVSEPKRC